MRRTQEPPGPESTTDHSADPEAEISSPSPEASPCNLEVALATVAVQERSAPEVQSSSYREIPVGEIKANPANPRRDAKADDTLIASVKKVGIIEPLIVRPVDEDGEKYWMLLAGHRRLDAAVRAGHTTVPAVERDADDPTGVEVMLIENLAREDLTPIEEARGIEALVALGRTQRQVAEVLGVSQSHVSKRLTLLKLPEAAREAVDSGGITVEQGVAIGKLPEKNIKELFKGGVPQEWHIRSAVDRYERGEEERKLRAKFEAEGVVILKDAPAWNADCDHPPVSVHQVARTLEDLEAHKSGSCRAVYIRQTYVQECCTDPTRHPELPDEEDEDEEQDLGPQVSADGKRTFVPDTGWVDNDDLTDEHRAAIQKEADERAEAARRRTIEQQDRKRRDEFVKQLMAQPAPAAVVIELAAWVLPEIYEIPVGNALELLGEPEPEAGWWGNDDAQAKAHEYAARGAVDQLRLLYAIVLDGAEGCEDDSPAFGRYLHHLVSRGYEPSELEAQILAGNPEQLELEQQAAQSDDEWEASAKVEPPAPEVTCEKKGKRYNVHCSQCGPIGFATTDAYAEDRIKGHLAEKHGIES